MQPNWIPEVVEVPITVTLDAYAANDVVGGTLSCSVPEVLGGCWISWLRLVDGADQAEPFKLWCFYDTPSTIANDGAHTPTEADWQKLFTVISIAAGDYDQSGSEACALVAGKDANTGEYHFAPMMSTSGKMYFRLVAQDTPDYAAADDLTLHICFMVR